MSSNLSNIFAFEKQSISFSYKTHSHFVKLGWFFVDLHFCNTLTESVI